MSAFIRNASHGKNIADNRFYIKSVPKNSPGTLYWKNCRSQIFYSVSQFKYRAIVVQKAIKHKIILHF
jgi:hypothetical protein